MNRSTVRALLAVTFLLIAAATAGYFSLTADHEVRDADNCIVDRSPAAVVGVLIDESDAFAQMDVKRLALVQQAIFTGTSRSTLVLVAVLTDSQVEPIRWVGQHCIDPTPKDGLLARLTGNPKVQRAIWRRRSEAPLGTLLQSAAGAAPAERWSYIGQALFVISRRPEFAQAKARHLVVFSDMLEKSDVFSAYAGRPKGAAAAIESRPEWRGALSGFQVTVVRAYRPHQAHLNAVADAFWGAYGKYSGAAPWEWR